MIEPGKRLVVQEKGWDMGFHNVVALVIHDYSSVSWFRIFTLCIYILFNGTNKPTLPPLQSLSCLSSVTLVLTIKLVSIHLTAKVLTRPRPIGHVSILSSFYFKCQPFGFWLYIPTHTKRSKASFFDWALFCQKELFFSWISPYWGEFLHIGEQWTDLFLCARLLTDFCLWVFFCMLIISSCNAL